jgi:L-serine dehydratase
MISIKELYKIGCGPSSSHTMGPQLASQQYLARQPEADAYRIHLFGSLAATGKGHLTDQAIARVFAGRSFEIFWKPEISLPWHPNGLLFEAINNHGEVVDQWEVFSVGGGSLEESGAPQTLARVYPFSSMHEIFHQAEITGQSIWEMVEQYEGEEIWSSLRLVWRVMCLAIERGLQTEGVLPGGLGVSRRAWSFFHKSEVYGRDFKRTGRLSAYALAVAEENASGGEIVTAPTCGSCGVLPATLRYIQENMDLGEERVLRSLATAGIIGNLVKHNASISGAAVGCQGEIGTACAMAAGAAAQLMGGTVRQIEYAAEMGLEHHLGLTCDPVAGMVQIPCIERNVFAAERALSCAEYALFTDGSHRIPFDEVVSVMRETGHDIPSLYRETAAGGLARAYGKRPNISKLVI